MPLSSYSELKAHIASHLFDRNDLASEIADFIRLAEGHMSNNLKCREMDVTQTLTITAGEADVPAGLQSVRSLRLTDAPYTEIAYEPIDVMEARRPDAGGTIQVYDIVGEKFVFWPPVSGTARLRYRADIPELSDLSPSNWILAEHPHLYVYGALWQAYLYLKDDARAREYGAMFTASLEELNARDRAVRVATAQIGPSAQVV